MKWLITLGAVAVGIAHLAWPALTIDGITIALILIALSPWLGEIYKAIEFPGGLKIEYHDLEKVKERARSAGLLSPKEGVGGGGEGFSFELISDRDPNLALAGLRIEIETRLNRIAQASGIPHTRGIGRLLPELQVRGLLAPAEAGALREMTDLLNSAVHGAKVDPSAAAWALDVGPCLLRVLDEKGGAAG